MLPRRLASLSALSPSIRAASLASALMLSLAGCATLGMGTGDGAAVSAQQAGAAGAPADCAPGVEGCDEGGREAPAQPLTSVDEIWPITSEEVSFPSGEDSLAGTLYRPVDEEPGEVRRRPAVVLLHDFGPTGRDGLFRRAFGVSLPVEVAVYRGLAERLASHGFVVLTYDKRTCVKSAAPWCDYPRRMVEEHRDRLAEALVDDGQAAMTYLGGRDDVDPEQLHLIGHGQGAELALALEPTGRRVLLAPSPHPADALVRHQTARSIEALEAAIAGAEGTTRADLWKKQLAELQSRQQKEAELFASIRAGEDSPDAFGLSAESWRGLIALHDTAMERLDASHTPVLAVMGELDLDLPQGSEEEMEERFSQGGGEESRLVVVPTLTHLMVEAGEDADPTVVSEAVIAVVLDFLTR